ncbi:SDR family NAD(P)-dependent oxidoreductase [Paenibacillus sp. LHD-117]|uniref:SDR family NAD(P)-dependent oxidoreductase n=1 Tax=Paenibacillus sp. LHD-117 TaxID=3071412 RepID=UPI0027E12B82|nr:SDR family NAD(P)-dependent oxidoreductase [Paenibacillus sp. LHD-117]MDQ6420595.1 SDR family NAD(P)-dependent oxidoreductase [Paenibacillus sp. LHD-117]
MRQYSLLENLLFPSTPLNGEKLRRALQGRTIVITGASSGIGERLSYLLGQCDAHLILTARRVEKLQKIKKEIEQIAPASAKVTVYDADLRNEEELDGFLAFIHSLPTAPNIVVSNAGLSIRRSIFDSLDRSHDFARTMAINYTAPVRLLLSVIPELERNRGQIINVSTINVALIPFPHWAAYQASKAAFDTWFRSASPELHARGIATTSVYLPLVRTPMIAPTDAYAKMPAMSADHAARRIAKSMYTKQRTVRPWWLPFGQLASIWGRGIWERVAPSRLRRKE